VGGKGVIFSKSSGQMGSFLSIVILLNKKVFAVQILFYIRSKISINIYIAEEPLFHLKFQLTGECMYY